MDDVIAILGEMGAENVEFIQDGVDDTLAFVFQGRTVVLYAIHHNDSTGGIDGAVEVIR